MPRSAHPRSARARASAVLALFALLFLAAPALAAPPHLETWHRLNPPTEDQAPEHERLQCLPGVTWVCRYDKLPEPDFHLDNTIAMFHGREVAVEDVECPEWFEPAICEGMEQVIVGVAAFNGPNAFRTTQALILTDGDGIAPFYIYWIDLDFVCPWYTTFADALAANPGFESDCIFAP